MELSGKFWMMGSRTACLSTRARTHARTHAPMDTPAHPHTRTRRTDAQRTDAQTLSRTLSLSHRHDTHTHSTHTHAQRNSGDPAPGRPTYQENVLAWLPLVVASARGLCVWRLCAPSLPLQMLIGLLLDPILAARQVRVHLVAEPASRGVTHACVEEAVVEGSQQQLTPSKRGRGAGRGSCTGRRCRM